MIVCKSRFIIFSLLLACLLLTGCSEEDRLARRGYREMTSGNYEAAIKTYNRVLSENQHNAEIFYNRGYAWNEMGNYDNAISDYTKAIELDNGYIDAYGMRGSAWDDKGEYDKAIADYTTALQLNPSKDAMLMLFQNRAIALSNKGDYEKAMHDYTKRIEYNPANPETYYYRAEAWYELGEFEKAILDYTKALDLNPKFTHAVFNRANTFHEMRKYASAVADYKKTIDLDPQKVVAYNNYSWLLSTCPDSNFRDGVKAITLVQRAISISPNEALLHSTLAAAYAESGQYKTAVLTAEKALSILEESDNRELKDEIAMHLKFYKDAKSWREDVKKEEWMRDYEVNK